MISVIVTVYNIEKYLGPCIKSILGSTYQDLEVILVDDGSKDGSGEICDQFAQADGRVKVNGEVCTMRGKKIRNGDSITVEDYEVIVSAPTEET